VSGAPVIQATGLSRHYEVKRSLFGGGGTVRALNDATFTLNAGQTLAVVGESGCGKSTLARLVTQIERPTAGTLKIGDVEVGLADAGARRKLRQTVQIVFQDPYGSLNPRHKIGSILEEPLKINTDLSAGERRARALAMMERVGLRPEHHQRYPHMFSGGQRQRIAVARALMLNPRVVVSIQAQVLNLLADLQEEFDLAYLFISHDLSVVRHIADEVIVMYLGRAVEHGSREQIFRDPRHPYTQALLSATPVADPERKRQRIRLSGELPSPFNPPNGCAFHPRCPYAEERCTREPPEMRATNGGTKTACHGVEEDRVPHIAA
jgi:dipeptide transport system ATP-binding protein